MKKVAKNLIIVESKTKAKSLESYLSSDYQLLPSFGHVRQLPSKTGSVDPANEFSMHYIIIEKNMEAIQKIIQEAKSAKEIFLAADPDREGEAICWHLSEILVEEGLEEGNIKRISFHEISQKAILEALEAPRKIEMNLVDAQQARLALDYLFGFSVSPLLWRKIYRGLSAGRVQSPALRMIVEREQEIEDFQPREYWDIVASCQAGEREILAQLTEFENKKIQQFSLQSEAESQEVEKKIIEEANGRLTITEIQKRTKVRRPPAPYMTSTLQQDAANKLDFQPRKTMKIAQQLYEGLKIGKEQIGLITYMRTDSLTISADAIQDLRSYIESNFGKENLPEQPNIYKTKAKNAQEAHEAIRPVDITKSPENFKQFLTEDQQKLYTLIWRRTLASQMINALYQIESLILSSPNALFRASASSIVTKGFLELWADEDGEKSQKQNLFQGVKFSKGDQMKLNQLGLNQHFTQPPPRFSQGSLVAELEKYEIGRPSTYATVLYTLILRKYATLVNKRFHPTDIGRVVSKFLVNYFSKYVDYGFTADLENQLDEISCGKKNWRAILRTFWHPFKEEIAGVEQRVSRSEARDVEMDRPCPECGKKLLIRLSGTTSFIGCQEYPKNCKYFELKEMSRHEQEVLEETISQRICGLCSAKMELKLGRYGKFAACSRYPNCRYVETLIRPIETTITCPMCNKFPLLKRRSERFSQNFYGCKNYPKCRYSVWAEPIKRECPSCHWPILVYKVTKRFGKQIICPQKQCRFQEKLPDDYVYQSEE